MATQYTPQLVAESRRICRFLHPGAHRIVVTADSVRLEMGPGVPLAKVPIHCIDDVILDYRGSRAKLTVCSWDGGRRSISGMPKEIAMTVRDAIFAEATRAAEDIGQRLKRVMMHLSGTRYVRHSNSREIHNRIVSLIPTSRQCGKLVRERLKQGEWEALTGLRQFESIEAFEEEKKRLNDRYVTRTAPSAKRAAGADLTDEQAEAIATDEDVTLVLAGAGTGKTKVIVGKVAHLVRNEGVSPSEILVLAYNKKAEEEVKERLSGESDLSGTHVFTFNAFGYGVVAKCEGKKRAVSKLAEDDRRLINSINHTLIELFLNPLQPKEIKDFIASNGKLYRSPFSFNTLHEYGQYVTSIELRGLNGSLVKSFEELEIANYLTAYGITFVYERPYAEDTTTPQHRQYHPDFFLPEHDIYIEHFALDEEGLPPQGWDDYADGVKWKRATHNEFGTTLIETYSWQYSKGILFSALRSKLEERGVKFERVPDETLVRKLKEHLKASRLANLLFTFLNHVKTEDLKADELRKRAAKLEDRERGRIFLRVFERVRANYESRLREDEEIDFHDQINLAANHMGQGRWKSPYRYILVDEFQDISRGRMRVLQELRRQNTAYFLVGDDWQSIYRFAGSDVGLVRTCDNYLGYVQRRTLSQTFRFGEGILGPSTKFIKRNPEQTQRTLTSSSSAEDEGMTVVVCQYPEDGVLWALKEIRGKANGKRPNVLVLGRYNNSKKAMDQYRWAEFSTVHRAKGREADYIVVLDLKDGRWGFPSKVEDDPLLDIVLPPVDGKAYPFAEERRLFYVAMTRARRAAYLVTDSVRTSEFIREIQEHDEIPQVGAFAPKCPRCGVGVLIRRKGPYSTFMGCTKYGAEPSCQYTEQIDMGPRREHCLTGNVLRRFSSGEG